MTKGGVRSYACLAAMLCVFLGGCLQPGDAGEAKVVVRTGEGEPRQPAVSNASDEDPWWGTQTEIIVARLVDPLHPEADVLCIAGGGIQVPRQNGRVVPGTIALRVDVSIDPESVFPGVRVGYALDSNAAAHAGESDVAIRWLRPVYMGSDSIDVEVDESQFEDRGAGLRWVFYYELNPGADELCYTGAGVGGLQIDVAAVRDPNLN